VSFEVRVAVPDDVPILAELEREARTALVGARGGDALLAEQHAIADWAALTTASPSSVWVATIDDVVVGYLQASIPGRGGTGIVHQVYVVPDARELGFGDDMLLAAMDAMRTAGGVTVEGWALPGDRDTKNLFERAGVTARKIIVSKPL
jgi:ribosomal protein S18 acetylase RimI-like enzyme